MSDPELSVTQEVTGVVDMGAESFSVDNLVVAESEKTETDTSAAEPEGATPAQEDAPTETDTVEAADPEGGDVDEDIVDSQQALPDDPPGVEKRIGKLTKKYRDQERLTVAEADRRRAAEAEAETLRAENETLKAEQEQAEIGDPPNEDHYDTEAEYLEALTDYKVDLRFAELDKKSKERATDQAAQNTKDAQDVVVTRTREALAAGADKYDDFSEVVGKLNVPTESLTVLQTLDNAADVAYALGSDPAKVDALSKMTPALVGAEMQKVSMNLKRRQITKAPAPIKPVGTEGTPIKTLDSMSNAEYRAYRDKQDRVKRGG